MVILISDQILRVSGSRGHIHTRKTICYLFKPFLDKNILLFRGKKRVVEKRERKKNITLSLYLEKGMRLK